MAQPSAATHSYDVVVIGGGPGGSTISTLLARQGWRVAVLEKDRHPRFHIGESLLPQNNRLFAELGVLEQVEAIGVVKNGAEFNSTYHGKSQTFYFSQAIDCSITFGYQVHRADLDHILIRNAERSGVEVFEGTRAVQVDFHASGVRVLTKSEQHERTWEARFLVDASGRDTFLASALKMKQANRNHASAAIFGHYEGATRLPGRDEGNISIYWFDHGWIWLIPLTRGITSVGAVCWPYYLKAREGGLDAFLDDTLALCPAVAERLAGARRIAPATATGNYSYEARRATGDRFLMVGDAFAFVDPVFSSGVYLAMMSGFHGAEVVDQCLREPERARSAIRAYERRIRRGIQIFKWFIYRITSPSMRDLIMYPQDVFGVVRGLVSFLAGDIFRSNGVRFRVWIFKGIYYVHSAFYLRRSLRAVRRRRQNIRPAGAA